MRPPSRRGRRHPCLLQRNNELVLVSKPTTQSRAIRALRGRKKTGMTTEQLMGLLRDGD